MSITKVNADVLDLTDGYAFTGAVSGAGKIVQVVTMTKTDYATFSSSSTSTFVDLTGMTLAITPTSSSNKILIMANIQVGANVNYYVCHVRLLRGSTPIGIGDADGASLRDTMGHRNGYDSLSTMPVTCMFEDSPSTTSETTYKFQGTLGASYSGTFHLNLGGTGSAADYALRPISTITLWEISA